MATPFTYVYEYFLSKISDYSFLGLTDTELAEDLLIYLKSAINEFDACKKDLSLRNDVTGTFTEELTEREQDILANLMVVAYLKSKVVTSEHYKLAMSDSDYRIYSQANHIKEVHALYTSMRKESQFSITKYTYYKPDLDKLL